MILAYFQQSLTLFRRDIASVLMTAVIYSAVSLGILEIVQSAVSVGSSFVVESFLAFGLWFLLSYAVSETTETLGLEKSWGTLEQAFIYNSPISIIVARYLVAFVKGCVALFVIFLAFLFIHNISISTLWSINYLIYILLVFGLGMFLTLIFSGLQLVLRNVGTLSQVFFFLLYFSGGIIEAHRPDSLLDRVSSAFPLSPIIKLLRVHLNQGLSTTPSFIWWLTASNLFFFAILGALVFRYCVMYAKENNSLARY